MPRQTVHLRISSYGATVIPRRVLTCSKRQAQMLLLPIATNLHQGVCRRPTASQGKDEADDCAPSGTFRTSKDPTYPQSEKRQDDDEQAPNCDHSNPVNVQRRIPRPASCFGRRERS